MVSRLHLVARVDGSDESLLLELAPGVDDGLFPSHPQLTHQLRICYFKPFGPFQLIGNQEQPQVHGLFLGIEHADALLAERIQLSDVVH